MFASHIRHNVIRKKKQKYKMWSKKWSLKRNVSCVAHLLNELLETNVDVEYLEMMPSRCRQVNWGNCGISWVNCAVLCVKDDWEGKFWSLWYCLSKLRSLFSFSVRYESHNKIAHFNWEGIGRFNCSRREVMQSNDSSWTGGQYQWNERNSRFKFH
jgi:hypothetical protein